MGECTLAILDCRTPISRSGTNTDTLSSLTREGQLWPERSVAGCRFTVGFNFEVFQQKASSLVIRHKILSRNRYFNLWPFRLGNNRLLWCNDVMHVNKSEQDEPTWFRWTSKSTNKVLYNNGISSFCEKYTFYYYPYLSLLWCFANLKEKVHRWYYVGENGRGC